MPYGYNPYQYGARKSSSSRPIRVHVPASLKKWLLILAGILAILFIGFYLLLGDLRFFANHYLGLTFFKKHYLVLLQNNYELRPTGGFITAYGTVDTFMGTITDIEFKNSYEIDTTSYVTPPKVMEELLKNEWYQGYTFRDANWEPDLRKSAPEIIQFYGNKYPDKKNVDGLITVNFSLIENLVGRLGGVELNGKSLNYKNLFSALEFEVNNIDRHNVEALKDRKSILGDLAALLMSKAKRHPFITRNVLIEGLRDKDISIWFNDESLEEKLIQKSWANAMTLPERSDALGVNLANLGAKKADRYLQTEVYYYANITNDIPQITTEVVLRYPGFTNTYGDNYKGYLRIYIPKEATLSSSPVDSDIETDETFRSVGNKIVLPAGSKVSLTYVYTLPRTTFLPDQFRLHLIKQPGTNTLYHVTVEAAEGQLFEGEQFKALENRAVFMGPIENDTDLLVGLMADPSPPYPIEQEFDDLNHVKIIWNKPIDSSVADDPANYTVIDLDKNNPTTDQLTVTKAELSEPNILMLELEGVTAQKEEQYQITLKNIKDLAGDVILPNPKIITAVQRIKPKPAPEIHLGEVPAPL